MTPSAPVVRTIDHFYVRLDDPITAMSFLTVTLGLPVAWPLSSYGQFASGGVCLGNANFELLQSNASIPQFMSTKPASINGIAFEPTPLDDTFLEELDRRGVPHTPLLPHTGTVDGAPEVLWTNVLFTDFISERCGVFLCQYRNGVDYGTRRAALEGVGGGALGIEGAEEIRIGSLDQHAAIERWQRLFDPLEPAGLGCWQLGGGPALRIVPSERDSVDRFSLRIKSRRIAQRVLDSLEIPSRLIGEDISVEAPPLAGLDLRLVAANP